MNQSPTQAYNSIMLKLRPKHERGRTRLEWLDSFHTFSFGDYHDRAYHDFGSLRVINEDFVAPSMGFGMHPHRDMEIVTYVLEGALEHRDSLGNGEVLRPGEFQRMSAGTGIRHSEFNPSKSEPVHLYQIWLHPSRRGLEPSYEQRPIPAAGAGEATLVASPDGAAGSLRINQDARIYVLKLGAGGRSRMELAAAGAGERRAWVQVMRGEASVNGVKATGGDGIACTHEPSLTFEAGAGAELMIFDLA